MWIANPQSAIRNCPQSAFESAIPNPIGNPQSAVDQPQSKIASRQSAIGRIQ
jgi:hypothetical protein